MDFNILDYFLIVTNYQTNLFIFYLFVKVDLQQ